MVVEKAQYTNFNMLELLLLLLNVTTQIHTTVYKPICTSSLSFQIRKGVLIYTLKVSKTYQFFSIQLNVLVFFADSFIIFMLYSLVVSIFDVSVLVFYKHSSFDSALYLFIFQQGTSCVPFICTCSIQLLRQLIPLRPFFLRTCVTAQYLDERLFFFLFILIVL